MQLLNRLLLVTALFAAFVLYGCAGQGNTNPPAAPQISAQPTNQSATPGTSVTFSVTATGSGLTYQWYFGSNAISGATGSTYTITSVTAKNGGNYYVVISNGGGSVTSSTVTLTVTSTASAPTITTQPTSLSITSGSAATFTVAATGTSLTYQWYFNGGAIIGANSANYTITNVTTANVGTYYVIVSNSIGSATSNTVTLSLANAPGAPVITTQPTSVTVAAGAPASFTVVATGSNLSYQWSFNNVAITGATSATYTISAVTSANVGNYSVVVSNTNGTVVSNTASLSLTGSSGKPVITTEPSSILPTVGSSGSLTVVATGSGLTYQWYEGGSYYNGGMHGGTLISGATQATYTINPVSTANIGSYYVAVTNGSGTVTSLPVTIRVMTTNGVYAVYEQEGSSVTTSATSYSSNTSNESAIWVTNAGSLTMTSPTISTSGSTTSSALSAQYGLNAAVITDANSGISLTGGTVTTTGSGADGLFVTSSGALISAQNATITTSGGYSSGVGVSYGGSITLTGMTVTTSGLNAPPIATGAGGGSVTVNNGTYTASSATTGSKSPGIYSTGTVTLTGATVSSAGDNGVVLDSGGLINSTSTAFTGYLNGLLIENTTGSTTASSFSLNGGSVKALNGDAVHVAGANATITLSNNATLSFVQTADYLLNILTGSTVTFNASSAALSGNIVADSTSSLNLNLTASTTLKGIVTNASLSLDSTSKWTVTGTSSLQVLTDTGGISGTSITNIIGNGNTVTYNSALAGNVLLAGKTYSLVGGGQLTPQ